MEKKIKLMHPKRLALGKLTKKTGDLTGVKKGRLWEFVARPITHPLVIEITFKSGPHFNPNISMT